MNKETKDYIDNLDVGNVPWNRMFTAYGTAEQYPELLSALEQADDIDTWKTAFNRVSDFEHQSTMFPPAPFALVFIVRMLRERLVEGKADDIVKRMIHHFTYYVDICADAAKMKHAQPLEHFADLLDDRNLLPEEYTEEDLYYILEDPEAVSDELFCSLYYYSLMVLSQIPDILDRCKNFPEESHNLRNKIESAVVLFR